MLPEAPQHLHLTTHRTFCFESLFEVVNRFFSSVIDASPYWNNFFIMCTLVGREKFASFSSSHTLEGAFSDRSLCCMQQCKIVIKFAAKSWVKFPHWKLFDQSELRQKITQLVLITFCNLFRISIGTFPEPSFNQEILHAWRDMVSVCLALINTISHWFLARILVQKS